MKTIVPRDLDESNFLEKRRLWSVLHLQSDYPIVSFVRQEVKMSDSDSSGIPPIKRCRIAAGYEKSWEKIPELAKWLARSPKGREFGRCRCCNEDFSLDSGLASLAQHCMQWSHFFCLMKVPYQHRQNLVRMFGPAQTKIDDMFAKSVHNPQAAKDLFNFIWHAPNEKEVPQERLINLSQVFNLRENK